MGATADYCLPTKLPFPAKQSKYTKWLNVQRRLVLLASMEPVMVLPFVKLWKRWKSLNIRNISAHFAARKTWSVPLLVFGIVTSTIAALPLLEEPGRIRPQLLHRSDPLFEDWEKWKIFKSISIYWKITYDVVQIAKKWIIKSKRFSPKKKHRGSKALYRRRFWKVAADNHKKLHLKKLQSINIYYEVKYSNLDKMTI